MRQDVIIIIIWKWLKLFSFDSDFCVCLLQSSMNFSHIVMSSSCCIELCRKTINFNFDKLQKVLVSHTHKYLISDISRDDESSLSTLTMAHREKLYHIKVHWWKSEYLIKLTDSTFTHSSKLENGSISSNHTTFSTLHSLCAIPSNRIYFVTMTDIYVRLTMTELRQTSDRLISYTRIDALFPGIFKWRKNLSRSMHDVTHIWHERERGRLMCAGPKSLILRRALTQKLYGEGELISGVLRNSTVVGMQVLSTFRVFLSMRRGFKRLKNARNWWIDADNDGDNTACL